MTSLKGFLNSKHNKAPKPALTAEQIRIEKATKAEARAAYFSLR